MTDNHSAEFFNKAHFWVVTDLFVMYNLPMQQGSQKLKYLPIQQGSQKLQYSMKILTFFISFIQIHNETHSTL